MRPRALALALSLAACAGEPDEAPSAPPAPQGAAGAAGSVHPDTPSAGASSSGAAGASAASAGAAGATSAGPPDTSAWRPTKAASTWPDEAGEPIATPTSLAQLAFLGDVSRYGRRGKAAGRETAGSFAVGNGSVFALVGLDGPANTMTNAVGPGYQKSGSFFGDSWLSLERDGAPLPVDDEATQRPRGSAIARSWARSPGVTLTVTDAAVPGRDLIVRHVAVRALEAQPAGLTVRLSLAREGAEAPEALADALLQRRGGRTLAIACEGAAVDGGGVSLAVAAPHLDEGAEHAFTCVYSFAQSEPAAPPVVDPVEALRASHDDSAAQLSQAMAIESGDRKVDDLYEGALITLFTQTAPTGVVSQMSRYTSGWLRDAEGSTRLLLAAGLDGRARAQLDAIYESLRVLGRISNSFPLDTPLEGFTEPDDPRAFWMSVPFMEKYRAAEAPSYFPLLHARYVDATDDESVLSPARMAMLEACLLRQEVDEQGLLPFSGDETYHIAMGAAVTGLPVSVSTLGTSAGSSFLLAAAADALVGRGAGDEVKALAGRVRAAAEATYWRPDLGFYLPLIVTKKSEDQLLAPYEDVSLSVLWHGYLPASDERAAGNLAAIVSTLMHDDGLVHSGSFPGFTGMVPGMFLQNVAAAHRPEEELAFDALDRAATPSGHFEEIVQADTRVLALPHDPSGGGGDTAARYRSWETGDVGFGLLSYLVGLTPLPERGRARLSPHLAHGQPRLAVRGAKVKGARFDLLHEGFDEGVRLTITQLSGPPIVLDVELHGGARLREVWLGEGRGEVGASGVGAARVESREGASTTVVGVY